MTAPPPPVFPLSPPAAFVAEQGPTGASLQSRLLLRSATTGRVTRTLGTFGGAFTNNGLAVTSDLSAVFYTLAPRRHGAAGLRVMRLDTATGRRRLVAAGSEPALSRDNRELAYGAVPDGISVRDLATGATRTLSLTRRLGGDANLTLTSITWLADGDDVVVVAPPQFVAAAAVSRSARGPAGSCHPQSHPVLVFVHVPPAPAPLTAHCVTVSDLDPGAAVTAPSPAADDAVRVASVDGRRFTIRDIAADGTATTVLSTTRGLPIAFDPAGERLLYLRGSRPPALWAARIASGRLTDRRELIPDSPLGAAAW